jgi:hypothetical protein
MAINPQDGGTYFVKPLEELEPFRDFLSYVQEQELTPANGGADVKYAQTRTS